MKFELKHLPHIAAVGFLAITVAGAGIWATSSDSRAVIEYSGPQVVRMGDPNGRLQLAFAKEDDLNSYAIISPTYGYWPPETLYNINAGTFQLNNPGHIIVVVDVVSNLVLPAHNFFPVLGPMTPQYIDTKINPNPKLSIVSVGGYIVPKYDMPDHKRSQTPRHL